MLRKFLPLVVYMLAGLALVFLSLGLFFDKIYYSNEILVEKSLEDSWIVYTDESKIDKWIPEITEIETIKKLPGEAGSHYKLTMIQDGSTYIMDQLITEYRENELHEFILENDVLKNVHKMRFSDENGYTRITSSSEIEAKNYFMSCIFALMHNYFKESDMKTLEKLKRTIVVSYVPRKIEGE